MESLDWNTYSFPLQRPFCCCAGKTKAKPKHRAGGLNHDALGTDCRCAERDLPFEWVFSNDKKTDSVVVNNDGKDLSFHPTYSNGTAVCLGQQSLDETRHHYWEIRMTTPVYGTAVMVGIANDKLDIHAHSAQFVSLIGMDDNSWGYSYLGYVHHNTPLEDARPRIYGNKKWGQGSIIGAHLDRWRGRLEFYLNRRPLGVAFTGIPSKGGLFPIVSSTAAKSGMRLVCSLSYRSDLAFDSAKILSRSINCGLGGISSLMSTMMTMNSSQQETLRDLLPPGIRTFVDNNCWFLFGSKMAQLSQGMSTEPKSSDEDDMEIRASCSLASAMIKAARQNKSSDSKAAELGVDDEDPFYKPQVPFKNTCEDYTVIAAPSTSQCIEQKVKAARFVLKRKRNS